MCSCSRPLTVRVASQPGTLQRVSAHAGRGLPSYSGNFWVDSDVRFKDTHGCRTAFRRGRATLNSQRRGGEGGPPPSPRHVPVTGTRTWDRLPPTRGRSVCITPNPHGAECPLGGWLAGPPGTFLLFGYCCIAWLEMFLFLFLFFWEGFFFRALYMLISLFILSVHVTSCMLSSS